MAIVSEDNFGTDVYATAAAIKKHETLEADVKVLNSKYYHNIIICVRMYMYVCMVHIFCHDAGLRIR